MLIEQPSEVLLRVDPAVVYKHLMGLVHHQGLGSVDPLVTIMKTARAHFLDYGQAQKALHGLKSEETRHGDFSLGRACGRA